MRKYKLKGYLNGIIASLSYGTNPLFALPLYKLGLGVNSVLFYRYFFAVLIYGFWLKFFKKVTFRVTLKEFACLFLMAILFALSSVTLFESFRYIPSGISCTILFVYPLIVAFLSCAFFGEKVPKIAFVSMTMIILGIFCLNSTQDANLNFKGVALVLLSTFVYALYIVFVKYLKPIKHIKYDKLSFYVMFLGLSVFIWNLKFCTQLQPIDDWRILSCTIALAIFPTIISLETINVAIRLIGSVITAMLGALEPLSALFFGVLVFGEVLNFKIVLGIFLILSGVILIILRDRE